MLLIYIEVKKDKLTIHETVTYTDPIAERIHAISKIENADKYTLLRYRDLVLETNRYTVIDDIITEE